MIAFHWNEVDGFWFNWNVSMWQKCIGFLPASRNSQVISVLCKFYAVTLNFEIFIVKLRIAWPWSRLNWLCFVGTNFSGGCVHIAHGCECGWSCCHPRPLLPHCLTHRWAVYLVTIVKSSSRMTVLTETDSVWWVLADAMGSTMGGWAGAL